MNVVHHRDSKVTTIKRCLRRQLKLFIVATLSKGQKRECTSESSEQKQVQSETHALNDRSTETEEEHHMIDSISIAKLEIHRRMSCVDFARLDLPFEETLPAHLRHSPVLRTVLSEALAKVVCQTSSVTSLKYAYVNFRCEIQNERFA